VKTSHIGPAPAQTSVAYFFVRAGMSRRMSDRPANLSDNPMRQRRMEVFAFLIITAVLMPALAVATVGGYGFTVWIYQMIAGPPGPPSR
jgi:nitrate reductase NapE